MATVKVKVLQSSSKTKSFDFAASSLIGKDRIALNNFAISVCT